MGRTIITQKDIKAQAMADKKPGQIEKYVFKTKGGEESKGDISKQAPDNYFDKLAKYIPAKIIAAYIFIDGLIKSVSAPNVIVFWLVFFALVILTPLYLWRIQKVDKVTQLILSTVLFCVYAFGMGGPFAYQSWYQPYYGAILVALCTLIIPIINA